ncbi:MAG: hypothetical protein ACP5U2_05420 [Bryobacteraceae bacterium]
MEPERTSGGCPRVRRAALALLALATLCFALPQKRKSPPPPTAIVIVELAAHRTEGLVTIDGKLRNLAARPLEGLELVFEFETTDGSVVTRQRGTIESDPLHPGEEAEFRWQMRDHVRAVSFRIQAVERGGRVVMVKNSGPHYID